MLIYNFQKEFLGIDESDLRKMGFQNLSQLRAEAADFADLFVKTPGFIHNFKHVHWIDFVECAQSDDSSNVIIHANDKNFRCTIEIKTTFLVDAPSQKAYLVYLNNFRELSKAESDQVANDIYEKPAPQVANQQTQKLQTQKSSHQFDITSQTSQEVCQTQEIQDMYDTFEEEQSSQPVDTLDTPSMSYVNEDAPIELDMEETQEQKEAPVVQAVPATKEDSFDNSYVYDPNVASEELGLPLDLIEEFIEDFIAQAKDFKEQLYTAYNNADEDQIKTLSHKLKGVAANLRIEDAFEVLSIINTSTNHDEIGMNLDKFYKIVAKLSHEDMVLQKVPETTETTETPEFQETKEFKDDDDFTISFKDDDDFTDDKPLEVETLPEVEIPSEIETPIEVDNSYQKSYDKKAVANEIGIDFESFNELFDDFIAESKLIIKDIKSSIDEKNIELWRKSVLKLKGMSSNMRVDVLKDDLETLLKTNDVNVAKGAVNKLQTSLEKISNL